MKYFWDIFSTINSEFEVKIIDNIIKKQNKYKITNNRIKEIPDEILNK